MRFVKLMEVTRGKWACVIAGNHETRAVTRYHIDVTAIIAEHLGTKYQGGTSESGWLLLRLYGSNKLRNTVRIYLQHGWGGGELRGSDALKMQRLLWRKGADAVLMSHVHRPMAFPETVETVGNTGWELTVEHWGVIAYPMVGKHGYLARRGGNAPPVGYAVLTIKRSSDGSAMLGAELKAL
jgi:hypothetical protein